jgi:hypothetical protein
MGMNPKGLGFVKRKGDPKEMNLGSYYIGDDYAEALSEGIKISTRTHEINLSKNRLTEKGAKMILESLPPHIWTIDLSFNPGLSHPQANTSMLKIPP